jgi:hypothetical protein
MAELSLDVPDAELGPEQLRVTSFLSDIRLGDLSLVTEFREWRRRWPKLTYAMVRAGRRADARLQCRLAKWIVERDRA